MTPTAQITGTVQVQIYGNLALNEPDEFKTLEGSNGESIAQLNILLPGSSPAVYRSRLGL
ncbi:MAG: hypothetical protein ACOYKZ_02790 [Chlamydiia bacterium]